MQDIEKNNENDLVIDYDYKFNIVTDNDIKTRYNWIYY